MHELEFYLFGLGGYPDLPHTDDLPNRSTYIDLPNELIDPNRAQYYLHSYLDTLAMGEELGFDGIATTSQMGGPAGMTAQALLSAAYLAAATDRIPIAALGPIGGTFTSPIRLAEQAALVDVMSKGRLILGLPTGHGMNYHAASSDAMHPAFGRERQREAHDLLIKAFTHPGPFEWRGKYFHVPYANLWTKPVQQPYPPIWVPATGSKATYELCAENKYTYQVVFAPRAFLRRNIQNFKDACERRGYTPDPKQIALVIHTHVAETDEQARLEAEPHLLWCFQHLLRSPFEDAFPPGIFTKESLRGFMESGYRSKEIGSMSYEELLDERWAIIGSPETVTEMLEEVAAEHGAGRIVCVVDDGAKPNWMLRKSLTLMAEEVIPRFRKAGGKPSWAIDDPRPVPTHAELGAATLGTEPRATAEVLMPDGHRLEMRRAHLAERLNDRNSN
ncbi:MAG TPA: LLM class flavin-dependent oxidoreductase [Acidimicrobiales bacterium]|nr:LLM class flavin-dependent oxidoreductase [Acidimicrobiales bacterium]